MTQVILSFLMASGIDDLKKQVFYCMLDLAGRAYILVRYSDDVVVGRRGFSPEEKEKGLVLVFNSKMSFNWDESGISGRLVFGSTTEDCFIPAHAVMAVFSPDLSAQFSVSSSDKGELPKKPDSGKKEKPSADSKVVKVDFHKKR